MLDGQPSPVLRLIRRMARPRDACTDGDAQLLQRFAACRDEAAFAALVQRHGPMVLGVCRRALSCAEDAEDAFQATFLVLVRKAGSLRRPELRANWLYGVACRTAARAKAEAARRRTHERRAVNPHAVEPVDEVLWRDLRPVLDQEIRWLPDRYRAPFVLCYLEGRTNREAADRLGCPEGTVVSRLASARARLRRRLAGRGVALSAGAVLALASDNALSAAVPAPLAEATVKAAIGFAAGHAAAAGSVPARVAALTEGVVQAMWMNQVKALTAGLLAVAAVVWAAFLFAPVTPAAEQPREAPRPEAAPLVQAAAEAEEADNEEKVSVKGLPPVVVKTVPQAGDIAVDAKATTEIRVTFSKDMADKSWSWTQISEASYPKTTGKPHYDKDMRTCVLPVQLEPGKTYVIWLNPEKFKGFRDTDGRPAGPYLLVFETKP
jgi:RNA polymerase sigma-70 factor (ECF subfamily)